MRPDTSPSQQPPPGGFSFQREIILVIKKMTAAAYLLKRSFMQQQLFSLGDVARLLKAKPHHIVYLLSVGAVPEPQLRVAGKRLWTHQEIVPIAERLKIDFAAELNRQGKSHE
jgi:hypothetical protein